MTGQTIAPKIAPTIAMTRDGANVPPDRNRPKKVRPIVHNHTKTAPRFTKPATAFSLDAFKAASRATGRATYLVASMTLGLMTLGLTACGGPTSGADPSADADRARAAVGDDAPAPSNATPPASATGGPAPRGRLSGIARPLAYDLDLTIDPREARFSGRAAMRVRLTEADDGFWFHGKNLRVDTVQITDAAGETFPGTYEEVLASGVARLAFGRTLAPGEISVTIDYDAPFDRNLAGLFAVEEQGDFYALAKSESIQARKYMPGFDEPGMKAPFDIRITAPAGSVVISNGPEIAREPAGDGMERVTFATTRPLSTYLLSLAVGPFDVVERPAIPPNAVRDRPIPLRGVARRGRGKDLQYILDITPDFVRIFEEQLGVPYPYEKLDIVAAPQWPSGATELAAAISYRESRILADGTPPPALRQSLISVHAHEIAHMWFGNLVTPPWWDDLWLKEGFATWGTPFALEPWEPEGPYELMPVERALAAMNADALKSVRAVNEPIDDNDDIRNAYNAIPYSKGMAIIHMADSYFGPENFRPALGQYLTEFEDGEADANDFFQSIGKATGEPALTEAFRTFVEQPGVPFLDVAISCDDATPRARLTQRRYRPLGSDIAAGQRWVIPICLAHNAGGAGEADGAKTCAIMREETLSLDLDATACPAFVHPNAAGAGYYRWALDGGAQAALVASFDALSTAEKLSLVDSTFAAFEAGTGDSASVLAVIDRASTEPARQVVTMALGKVASYGETLLSDDARAAFYAYAGTRFRPRYDALDDPETDEEKLLKDALLSFLAARARNADLRAMLAGKAAAFIGHETARDPSALDADQYNLALSIAVQDLGEPFFTRLIAARSEIDDPNFDAASASALGASDDPALIARAREIALSGTLGTRETYGLIQRLFARPGQTDAMWDWYRTHFETILTLIPEQWKRNTPTIGNNFCTEREALSLAAFFRENGASAPGHERPLNETLEAIALCASFKSAKGEELTTALDAG